MGFGLLKEENSERISEYVSGAFSVVSAGSQCKNIIFISLVSFQKLPPKVCVSLSLTLTKCLCL